MGSGKTPSVLFTHVTTFGPTNCVASGRLPTMSIRSVAFPRQNLICVRFSFQQSGRLDERQLRKKLSIRRDRFGSNEKGMQTSLARSVITFTLRQWEDAASSG